MDINYGDILMLCQNLQVKEWKNEKELIIESDKLDRYLKFIKSDKFSNFKGIIISKHLGYKITDLSFLKDIYFIKSISISDYFPDITPLYYLDNLSELNLSENRQDIDLSHFKKLNSLSFDWNYKIKNLQDCTKLEELIIGKFNPKSKNMSELPEFSNLRDIRIVESTIVSLDGIGKYKNLIKLELYYLSRLEDIKEIEQNDKLEYLHLDGCKKIRNKESVSKLPKLRELHFSNCGEIKSIRFIKEMPALKFFSFVDTNVLDGDVSPCIGLEHCGFFNKRHYSHTSEEIEAINKCLTPLEEIGTVPLNNKTEKKK